MRGHLPGPLHLFFAQRHGIQAERFSGWVVEHRERPCDLKYEPPLSTLSVCLAWPVFIKSQAYLGPTSFSLSPIQGFSTLTRVV